MRIPFYRSTGLARQARQTAIIAVLLFCLFITACGKTGSDSGAAPQGTAGGTQAASGGEVTLTIGAYSVVKESLGEILPKFQQYWLGKTGQHVRFQESYEASGTQARAIVGGFEADVALLAMEGDILKIVKAGLITHDWQQAPNKGIMTESIVALGTREGNPLGIKDWPDLTRSDVKVLYPNPKTSGGAQWDINAIYGAGLKLAEEQGMGKDAAAAKQFLVDVHDQIESLDKSGRASMAAFEYGVGDVIVTYENELLARIKQGVQYNIVIPKHTLRIENPAAVIDGNVDKHGTREVAEAFANYLWSEEAQRIFMAYGFRPVIDSLATESAKQFKQPEDLFDIGYLGGWDHVRKTLYAKGGVWDQVLAGE